MATHTLSKRYDKIGIVPDVKISEKEDDWLSFVKEYFNKKDTKNK